MNKFICVFMMMSFLSFSSLAGEVKLPLPNKLNPTTLMHALNMRHSTKNFLDKEVDEKTLSSLLWAAYGVNRTTGERTIPTAQNQKDLKLFVIKKEGAFLYNADKHILSPVVNEDIRPLFQTQDYMKNVPLILVWTATNAEYGAMHAGSSYQNVALFCEAHKLGAVVRGFFDKDKVKSALKLNENEIVLISEAIGYPVLTMHDDKEVPADLKTKKESAPLKKNKSSQVSAVKK